MNNRQKRLCRALLDYYDESGAQPYPLSQLARKTGYDASDIYDKDSQSGDLWPFDPKARGNLAGMLSFSADKNPGISVTSTGLVALENLCKEEPPKPKVESEIAVKEIASAPEKPVPIEEPAIESPQIAPPILKKRLSPVPRSTPVPAPVIEAVPCPTFSSDEIAEARIRFKQWMKSEEALKTILGRLDGNELIQAAFDKFFNDFLPSRDS